MTKYLLISLMAAFPLGACDTPPEETKEELSEELSEKPGQEIPADLKLAMKEQEQFLKEHTTTLRRGEEVLVEKAGEQQLSGPSTGNPLQGYDLFIKTGAVPDGGTGARVFVTLWSQGSGVWTGARFFLDNPNRNDWEYGQLDDFHPRSLDLGGKIDYVQVEHDNSGNKPGWYLEYVKTTDISRNMTTLCQVNQWLATSTYPYSTLAERHCL